MTTPAEWRFSSSSGAMAASTASNSSRTFAERRRDLETAGITVVAIGTDPPGRLEGDARRARLQRSFQS